MSDTTQAPYWVRDESDGYPVYTPTTRATWSVDSIESAYIQPGGCVELRMAGEEGGMIHLCDFPQFVEQMTELLDHWQRHPERY